MTSLVSEGGMGRWTGSGLENRDTEVMFHRPVQDSRRKEGPEAKVLQTGREET